MALAHVSQYGETFDSLAGDHTVAEYLTMLFPGAKWCEIRIESGTVSVSEGKVLASAADGKTLVAGDDASEQSVRFEQVDLGNIHIFEPGAAAASTIYISARTF